MANTYKVKRGMVFWYNLDERIDKNTPPMITVHNKEYPDHRQYGMRHWLVISNNIGNFTSPTCNVIPITGSLGKANIPTHVPVTFRGRRFEALCEQTMTINTISLQDYAYTLSETDIRNVEKALLVQFDLSQTQCMDTDIDDQQRLESLMVQFGNHMKSFMECYEKRLTAILKIEESQKQMKVQNVLEAGQATTNKTFQHPTHSNEPDAEKLINSRVSSKKKLTQIEKFNARYPGAALNPQMDSAGTNAAAPMDNKNHKWTKELAEEYLHDTEKLPPKQIVAK